MAWGIVDSNNPQVDSLIDSQMEYIYKADTLEELAECVGGSPVEEDFDLRRLGEAISAYLDTVSPECRRVFLRRYWYCDAIGEIADGYGFTQGRVKSLLHRARKGLRAYLIEEGYDL